MFQPVATCWPVWRWLERRHLRSPWARNMAGRWVAMSCTAWRSAASEPQRLSPAERLTGWVRRVWPIRSLLRTTASWRLKLLVQLILLVIENCYRDLTLSVCCYVIDAARSIEGSDRRGSRWAARCEGRWVSDSGADSTTPATSPWTWGRTRWCPPQGVRVISTQAGCGLLWLTTLVHW